MSALTGILTPHMPSVSTDISALTGIMCWVRFHGSEPKFNGEVKRTESLQDRLAPRPHENFVVFKGRLNAEAMEAMQEHWGGIGLGRLESRG